ncbi:MAG: branched-chain amino acid ABC transporter permease [Acidimicrobiia bacterium]|nr:branched-chain amino acid ABC transporter permease [Acidimicrobiia bacterium]
MSRLPRTPRLTLLGLLLLGLAVMPLVPDWFPDQSWVTNSRLFSFTQMFMLITLASNWNLTGGFAGYVDFGHTVFFGIGAYGTGILMGQGWSFWPALAAGAVFAMIFALMIGYPTLRLKGPYFAIAMLGTFVAMREIVRVWKGLTGGGVGLTLPPYLNRPLFYWVTLILSVIVVTLMWSIRRSEFGASLIAIREDEVGAEMRGINTTVNKITAFAIAAFSTGIVGGLWAYQNTFIDPDIVFLQSRTVELVMMSMLGGLGTVAGPVIGAATIYWMRDVVWANFADYHLLVEGFLLILIVLYTPEGIMGKLGSKNAISLQKLWTRKSPVEEESTETQPEEVS